MYITFLAVFGAAYLAHAAPYTFLTHVYIEFSYSFALPFNFRGRKNANARRDLIYFSLFADSERIPPAPPRKYFVLFGEREEGARVDR
jgi:hypothetical protein